MKRDAVIAALALLALVVVSLLGHEPESPAAATRASGDFSFGGYRAWYDLLAREGVPVERFRRHHDALRESVVGTLIVAFPDEGVASEWNAAERDALRAWVRAGGHFVDVGETPPLVASGLPRAAAKRAGTPPPARRPASGKAVAPADEVVVLKGVRGPGGRLRGPWSSVVTKLDGRPSERIVPAGGGAVETLLSDDAGALVVRYRYGRGTVIAVAGAALFENRAIGRGDAARLAYLTAHEAGPGPVAFDEAVRGDIVERPWYRALTPAELVALALAALAGLLWVAYGIVPLGPAVRLRAAREPTSAEFVDAVAALYERGRARDHARDALLRDARRSLERAPRTAQNDALRARIAAAEGLAVSKDDALIAVATLARAARENTTIMMDRAPRSRARHRPSLLAGRRGSA